MYKLRRAMAAMAIALGMVGLAGAPAAGAWGYNGPYYNQWTPNYLAANGNINHWSKPGTRVTMRCWMDIKGQRWFIVTPYDWGGRNFYVKSYFISRQSIVPHC